MSALWWTWQAGSPNSMPAPQRSVLALCWSLGSYDYTPRLDLEPVGQIAPCQVWEAMNIRHKGFTILLLLFASTIVKALGSCVLFGFLRGL